MKKKITITYDGEEPLNILIEEIPLELSLKILKRAVKALESAVG